MEVEGGNKRRKTDMAGGILKRGYDFMLGRRTKKQKIGGIAAIRRSSLSLSIVIEIGLSPL